MRFAELTQNDEMVKQIVNGWHTRSSTKTVKPVMQKLNRQGTMKQRHGRRHCSPRVARVEATSEIRVFGGGDGLAADLAEDEAAAAAGRRERGGRCGNRW